MKLVKYILLIFIILLLLFPAVQRSTSLIRSAPLKGVFEAVPPPVLNDSTWYTGLFQEQYRKYTEDHIGLKPDLVRLFNQLDYSFFSLTHAERIVTGKEQYLFGTGYINAWLGLDFVGKKYCDEKAREIGILQNRLWNDRKILLVVVFVPDKGTYYPEFIPDRYLWKKKAWNNYRYYSMKLKESGINFIDFNAYLLQMKDTSRYPLYPKGGIHWSTYAAVFAADSLSHYIEAKLGKPVPHIVIDSIVTSSVPAWDDNDITRTLNLIWPPSNPVYAYPKFHYRFDTSYRKPSALFIGDSFYWNWFYPGIIENFFSNQDFLYYNKDVYSGNGMNPVSIDRIDLMELISRQNVIILMQTNAGNGDPGYGFVEKALYIMDPDHSRITFFERQIRNNPAWLKEVKKKADSLNIKLDEMIYRDALYLVDDELKKKQSK